jgi:16S rRNA processing protein RimM
MSNYFQIGKIVAVFGLAGELVLTHQMGSSEHPLRDVGALFVEEKKDSFIPYFISGLREKGAQELVVRLEGITDRESARKLLTKKVYLEEKEFRQQVSPDSPLGYLGFQVQDNRSGLLGKVAEIVEMPTQWLVKIYEEGHELLIPLNEETLQEVDHERAVLYVDLPEGLLDIYRK